MASGIDLNSHEYRPEVDTPKRNFFLQAVLIETFLIYQKSFAFNLKAKREPFVVEK